MSQQLAPVDLAAIQRPVRADLDRVSRELRRIIVSDFPIIEQVNEHLLRMQGKLFRPTLTLLSARAATGAVEENDVTLAAIVELIHVATLVHDDSVDHSVLRRGEPTINSMFSHQVAVIMGDYLYSRAIIELVALDDPFPLRMMSQVTNEMTVGEMRELLAYDALDYSLDDYDKLITAKTASLMAGACALGARRAPAHMSDALHRFGMLLGKAFQIADDVLDYTAMTAEIGKPAGHDLKEHKVTLPLILALEVMSGSERSVVRALMAAGEPSDEQVGDVVDLVHQRGGVERARERAFDLAEEARRELTGLEPSTARDALEDCITYVVDRRN